MSLLEDITSKDAQRIWSSACAIRELRDAQELALLAAHLDEIKATTSGVPLGGMLRPNSSHLDFALRKLEFVKSSNACLCTLYPADEMYNPTTEASSGNVTILATDVNREEWTTTYDCQCRVCGTRYRVEEEAGGHYPVWRWQRAKTS